MPTKIYDIANKYFPTKLQAYLGKHGCSSRYYGVSYNRYDGKYSAIVTANKIRYSLGYFEDEKVAARARDAFVLKMNLDRPLNNISDDD